MKKRRNPYGRAQCEYCCEKDEKTGKQTRVWFDRLVPNQKYCNELCRQYHEIELDGGIIMPTSRNFKAMSDHPDFRDLSITVVESDEDKLIRKVRRANNKEADRNTHHTKHVNPGVLYDFNGQVFATYSTVSHKKHQINISIARKNMIYKIIQRLIS